MNKPTIFISHSSKDVEMLSFLKVKLNRITGDALDVFLSSDGQSIPFGRNWLHKIEDGLKKASIMFVFITSNSITSNWIYFEAGFAYSKGIEVVPVGVGIDIAVLKAPLNLLQGFNINSCDGLNNIISIVNKKFDYSFREEFSSHDFLDIMSLQSQGAIVFEPNNYFDSIIYEIAGEYVNMEQKKTIHDVDKYFNILKDYLTDKDIKHSQSNYQDTKQLLVYGIEIVYKIGNRSNSDSPTPYLNVPRITFSISPYNFEKSFNFFVDLVLLWPSIDWTHLRFRLNENFYYISRREHLAAVFSTYPNEFNFHSDTIGRFTYDSRNINFMIYKYMMEQGSSKEEPYILGVSFKPGEVSYKDISMLLNSLYEKGIIKLYKH